MLLREWRAVRPICQPCGAGSCVAVVPSAVVTVASAVACGASCGVS